MFLMPFQKVHTDVNDGKEHHFAKDGKDYHTVKNETLILQTGQSKDCIVLQALFLSCVLE